MPKGEPYIPETITVHLGRPDADAMNVEVPFADYIKNVASSEIYPTWPEAALRANIYAIITFALNRIYTEWYRSRGYPFDITDSTQYDQKYTYGREVFENINRLVDEQLNTYIRRQGTIEPLFAAFCNGTTVTCEGLSQWGTVGLAEQGYSPYDILTYYYGDSIDLVQNVPVQTSMQSYPGFPLALGYSGEDVRLLQIQLNRISRNYPAIPKIGEITGSFGYLTQEAVLKFQEIFNLSPTGTVDEATWYRIDYIYTSVKRLAELDSEGIAQGEFPLQYEEELHIGMQGQNIRALQYYLAMVGAYYANVEPVPITGYFGEQTETSVKSFQRTYGLPETGVVDRATWYDLYRAYMGILDSMPPLAEETEEIVPVSGNRLAGGCNKSVCANFAGVSELCWADLSGNWFGASDWLFRANDTFGNYNLSAVVWLGRNRNGKRGNLERLDECLFRFKIWLSEAALSESGLYHYLTGRSDRKRERTVFHETRTHGDSAVCRAAGSDSGCTGSAAVPAYTKI